VVDIIQYTNDKCMCVVQELRISYPTFSERLIGTEFGASGQGMVH